ncbi:hypothetical protein ACIQZB_00240 [Streptomyces sp. NPDC097727]|uniref:hypothetical protein n=1 Tax=Streptomyces sp. NPDC097727 TaxID=3366092 RepID=UPI0037FC394E
MPVEPIPCAPGGGVDPGSSSCCAPSITSIPLCREDGTPLLLVLRSACTCDGAEAADPEVAGWIDPATGIYTAGAAPAGSGPCPSSDCASVSVLRLCDHIPAGEPLPFLRHLVHDCDGQVTAATDTALDGTTPYTPTGDVGECDECRPAPMCPQLLGLAGPETWTMPEGTESLTVTVVCGPVTVTDCAGNATTINECGTSFSWAAPATGACEPAALCSPFTVDVPEGAAVYINFVSPCGMGDAS